MNNRHHNKQEQSIDSSDLFPIREVSRQTGVNPVTLRAWERRYGLLKPMRTPKGHRLYTRCDVERVERVLYWLDRGVSVSQVKGIIDQEPEQVVTVGSEPYQEWIEQLQLSAKTDHFKKFDTLLNQLMAEYPFDVVHFNVVEPLVHPVLSPLDTVQQGWCRQILAMKYAYRAYNTLLHGENPPINVLVISPKWDALYQYAVVMLLAMRNVTGHLIPLSIPQLQSMPGCFAQASLLLLTDASQLTQLDAVLGERHGPSHALLPPSTGAYRSPLTHLKVSDKWSMQSVRELSDALAGEL